MYKNMEAERSTQHTHTHTQTHTNRGMKHKKKAEIKRTNTNRKWQKRYEWRRHGEVRLKYASKRARTQKHKHNMETQNALKEHEQKIKCTSMDTKTHEGNKKYTHNAQKNPYTHIMSTQKCKLKNAHTQKI